MSLHFSTSASQLQLASQRSPGLLVGLATGNTMDRKESYGPVFLCATTLFSSFKISLNYVSILL